MTQLICVAVVGAALAASPALVNAAPSGSSAPIVQAKAPPTDETLKDRIDYRLETTPMVKKYDIKVKVDDGVATLSGDVATAAQKAEAEKLAHVDGVKRVENNIKVDKDADKSVADRVKGGLSKTGEKITDAWITTKVKWFIMREDTLDKTDINVDTKDNVVTLKGSVRTQAQRAKAVELARNTDGVKRVVDQLSISTSER